MAAPRSVELTWVHALPHLRLQASRCQCVRSARPLAPCRFGSSTANVEFLISRGNLRRARLPRRRLPGLRQQTVPSAGAASRLAGHTGRSWRWRTRPYASCSRCCATAPRTGTRRSTTTGSSRSATQRAGCGPGPSQTEILTLLQQRDYRSKLIRRTSREVP